MAIGPISLMGSLLKISPLKLLLTACLMLLQVAITVAAPFLSQYLIRHCLSSSGPLFPLCGLFFAYKLVKAVVGMMADLSYYTLGYQYFARVSWELL